MPEPLVEGLGRLELGVADLLRSVAFYRDVARLEVVGEGDGWVALSGGASPWLVLHAGDPLGLRLVSFPTTGGTAALDAIEARLGGAATRPTSTTLRFTDLDGVPLEVDADAPARTGRGDGPVRMRQPLHAVWMVRDPEASARFFADVLGFGESDWIDANVVFLHAADRFHHSLGLGRSEAMAGRLDHFCILVEDIDDVMRARNLAVARDVPRRDDLIRHLASDSISTYIRDVENGICIEFCSGHEQVEPGRVPRRLPAAPETRDVWYQGGPDAGTVRSLEAKP